MCGADHLLTVGAVLLAGLLVACEPKERAVCCVIRAQGTVSSTCGLNTESQDFIPSLQFFRVGSQVSYFQFLISVIKYSSKSNLGEKRFIHLIIPGYIIAWKSRWQGLEAAIHITSIGKGR